MFGARASSYAPAGGGGFSETWTGTNSDPWNAGRWTNTSGTVDIQTNRGRIVAGGGSYAGASAEAVIANTADAEILVSVEIADGSEQYPMVWLRTSGSWSAGNAANGYFFRVNVVASLAEWGYYTAGSYVGGGTAGITYSSGKWWYRCQTDGTAIRLRVWKDGTSEPGTWNIDTTNGTHATGKAGLSLVCGSNGLSRIVYWDDLTLTEL